MARTPRLDRNLMNSMQYAICSNKHRTSVGKGLIFLCRACPRLWVHSISAKLAQLGLETIGFNWFHIALILLAGQLNLQCVAGSIRRRFSKGHLLQRIFVEEGIEAGEKEMEKKLCCNNEHIILSPLSPALIISQNALDVGWHCGTLQCRVVSSGGGGGGAPPAYLCQ